MSYKPIHAWKRKDKLPSKDPQKIIYGTQLQDEFDAISVTFDEVQGGFDEVKDKLESGGYSVEEAPADGDQYGRQQKNGKMAWTKIDSVGSVTWSEISDKPSTYPPSAHNHDGEYLKTETDPVFTSSVAFGITQDDIDSWNAGGGGGSSDSGPPVHIGDTAPPDPSEGDLWYDTSSDTLFLFDGTEWFSTESCGSGGGSGGEGWTLLSSVEANNSSVAQFTEFSDEFDDYKIIISDVIPSAKSALRMYIAIDGASQGSGYRWHNNHSTTANNAYVGQSNNATNRFTLFQDLPADDTSLASMEISAFGANNPAIGKTFFWNGICFYNGAGNLSFGAGLHNSIGKLTEMGIQMGNGKILSGNFKLYGIKK